jgi:hypothetical protein
MSETKQKEKGRILWSKMCKIWFSNGGLKKHMWALGSEKKHAKVSQFW